MPADLCAGQGDPANRLDARDRRRFERIEATVKVAYTSVDELFTEFTRDINEGGLFIATNSPLELGSQVSLQFQIPDTDESVRADGIVMWTRPEGSDEEAGMGIEFDDLAPEEREKINEVVRRLRTD